MPFKEMSTVYSETRKKQVTTMCVQNMKFYKAETGFKVLIAVVIKTSIFWDITPCNQLKVNRRFGGTRHFNLQCRRMIEARNQHESRWQAQQASKAFIVVFCLAYFLTLMMEATRSSETSDDFQLITWHYIPEDKTLLTQVVHIVKTRITG
jgi:hypothetical protein